MLSAFSPAFPGRGVETPVVLPPALSRGPHQARRTGVDFAPRLNTDLRPRLAPVKSTSALGKVVIPESYSHPRPPPVFNQYSCGSCWAIAAVDMIASRSGSKPLSITHPLTCVTDSSSAGCEGGSPFEALQFATKERLQFRRDGEYQQWCKADCRSGGTSMGTSGTSGTSSSRKVTKVPACGAEGTLTRRPPVRSESIAYLDNNHDAVRAEIVLNGPVIGMMMVYKDFMAGKWPRTADVYIHGHYSHEEAEEKLGGHALLITGFGVQDVPGHGPLPYWEVQNSWSAAWGKGGRCRIAMSAKGVNDGIGLDRTVNGEGGVLLAEAFTTTRKQQQQSQQQSQQTPPRAAAAGLAVAASLLIIGGFISYRKSSKKSSKKSRR